MHKHTIQKSRLHRSNLDGFFSPSHYLSWAYVSCNNSWNWVRIFFVFSRAWNKVPMRNRTSDLQIPRSGAVPLSHRDPTVSEVYHEVYIWHASYILLGSAMSIASCFVNKGRKILSFELGEEMEKDGLFFFVPTRDKTKKNHLSLFLYRAQNQPSFLFYLQK